MFTALMERLRRKRIEKNKKRSLSQLYQHRADLAREETDIIECAQHFQDGGLIWRISHWLAKDMEGQRMMIADEVSKRRKAND